MYYLPNSMQQSPCLLKYSSCDDTIIIEKYTFSDTRAKVIFVVQNPFGKSKNSLNVFQRLYFTSFDTNIRYVTQKLTGRNYFEIIQINISDKLFSFFQRLGEKHDV